MQKFYEFKKVDEQATDLYIYGDITSYKCDESDVRAFDFAKELSEIGTDLTVHINSYGGEVAEGLAIYNLLKSFGHKVTTVCDGFACSSASVIFMAGTERVMNKGSLLMIHNAWTCAQGNAEELRKQADDLEKITHPSIDIYCLATGLSQDEIKSMMDAETWMTADEALELGFATSIIEEEAKQSINEQYLTHQVFENKKMAKQIADLKEQIKGLQSEKLDGWSDFFNK